MLSINYASQKNLTIWFKKKISKGTFNLFWSSFQSELSQSHIFFWQDDKEKWLEFQKRKWEFQSKQRAERKRLRKEAETMGMSMLAVGRGPSTGMSSFIRQQARSIVDTPWQIIQVGISVQCSYLKDKVIIVFVFNIVPILTDTIVRLPTVRGCAWNEQFN